MIETKLDIFRVVELEAVIGFRASHTSRDRLIYLKWFLASVTKMCGTYKDLFFDWYKLFDFFNTILMELHLTSFDPALRKLSIGINFQRVIASLLTDYTILTDKLVNVFIMTQDVLYSHVLENTFFMELFLTTLSAAPDHLILGLNWFLTKVAEDLRIHVLIDTQVLIYLFL